MDVERVEPQDYLERKYMAVPFERDKSKLDERINEAEGAPMRSVLYAL